MAITLTYTFTSGTRALASQVNSNFSTLATGALDKTGDTMTGDLKFTDASYDIGKSGATRPRDIFASRNVVIGGTLAVTGTTTLTGAVVSNLIFTDATYDIGASGATRPRDLFLSRNALIGGTLGVTGVVTLTGGQLAFPATQAASAVANTLDDYEEGTWTPADGSGAGLSLTVTGAQYVKIGQLVFVSAYITYPSTADGTAAKLSGLPFTNNSIQAGLSLGWTDKAALFTIMVTGSATTIEFFTVSASALTNANLTTVAMRFSGCYRAAA